MIKRGDIYWADLSDAQGYETKDTRPCLVVSNDIQNRIGKRIIVTPLTSKIKKYYPFEVLIPKLKSKVMLDQVRVITIKRLGKKRISWLTNEEMKKIDLALHLALGIYFCLKKETKKADKLLFYSLIIITPIVFGSWIYFEVLK